MGREAAAMAEFIAGLIDVFADAPLTGNPLAVVQNADGLSSEQMRRIAGEFNQAETTFILQSTRADRNIEQGTKMGRRSILRVRITPDPELSGAGIVVLRGVIRL
jgi:predicted PhzF superfamily epimerase YddE/YHI9